MSTSLIMFLDRELPKEMVGKWITTTREHNGEEFEMGIENNSDILVKNSKRGLGYPLEGYAYSFEATNGEIFYAGSITKDLQMTSALVRDLTRECKWVFDIIEKLLNDGYIIKLLVGNVHPIRLEEFSGYKRLLVEDLKNINTILDYNVLYEIYKENN